MSDGPSPGGDRSYIYRRITDTGGAIIHNQWLYARANGQPVGVCKCGSDLMPLQPVAVNSRRTDYEASCVDNGHTLLAPMGKTIRKSGRKSERSET